METGLLGVIKFSEEVDRWYHLGTYFPATYILEIIDTTLPTHTLEVTRTQQRTALNGRIGLGSGYQLFGSINEELEDPQKYEHGNYFQMLAGIARDNSHELILTREHKTVSLWKESVDNYRADIFPLGSNSIVTGASGGPGSPLEGIYLRGLHGLQSSPEQNRQAYRDRVKTVQNTRLTRALFGDEGDDEAFIQEAEGLQEALETAFASFNMHMHSSGFEDLQSLDDIAVLIEKMAGAPEKLVMSLVKNPQGGYLAEFYLPEPEKRE